MTLDVSITHPIHTDFALRCTFQIPKNAKVSILGPSGSGKTTLLRALSGLLSPKSGHIHYNQTPWFDSLHNTHVPTWKRSIGYVFQNPDTLSHFSVRQQLDFAIQHAKNPLNTEEISDLIKRCHLDHLLLQPASELSGGEKQRLALVSAIIGQPGLLLLDEPCSALDHQHAHELYTLIAHIQNRWDIQVLHTSHKVKQALLLATHVMLVRNGIIQDFHTLFHITQSHPIRSGTEGRWLAMHLASTPSLQILPSPSPQNNTTGILFHTKDCILCQESKVPKALSHLPALRLTCLQNAKGYTLNAGPLNLTLSDCTLPPNITLSKGASLLAIPYRYDSLQNTL